MNKNEMLSWIKTRENCLENSLVCIRWLFIVNPGECTSLHHVHYCLQTADKILFTLTTNLQFACSCLLFFSHISCQQLIEVNLAVMYRECRARFRIHHRTLLLIIRKRLIGRQMFIQSFCIVLSRITWAEPLRKGRLIEFHQRLDRLLDSPRCVDPFEAIDFLNATQPVVYPIEVDFRVAHWRKPIRIKIWRYASFQSQSILRQISYRFDDKYLLDLWNLQLFRFDFEFAHKKTFFFYE